MMHPYLARRAGREPVVYFRRGLEPVLERTLGVPLFQEQMLQIAMVMADFSGAEAEELRRALSFHRSEERMNRVGGKMRAAMERKRRRARSDRANLRHRQLVRRSTVFPNRTPSASPIWLTRSAWLKTHRAPEFFAGLLNNQPMGFYRPPPSSRTAKRHGLKFSRLRRAFGLDCTIEPDDSIRLGLCVVEFMRQEHAPAFVAAARPERVCLDGRF